MGVPRPTEMTVRDLLQEELRKRGVTVVPEFSVSTPTGVLKPDILLRNGAPYVVETKLGAETKLLEAMVKLYDYSKYVTEAKGAFAVLFPEELRRPWPYEVWMRIATDPKLECSVIAIFKDLRPSQPFKGNLSQIADWMAGHVLRAPVVEADTGFAIRVLRDAVSYITASVKQLRGKELEDIFGGKSVFENILQYEEGKYPLEEMRQAATYLLVNQLLFYHVLSRVDASFPAVDEEKIRRPSDLMQYFEPVLKRDYSSIFGFDVASRLPEDATDVVKKVVMVVKALAPEKIRHDLLGKVFHELIPFEVRKAVAAFYTNNEAAELLAQLAIDKPDAKVMDLAVGSGTLLVAAYRRKRELLQKVKGTIELEDHKRFLEQDLTGIDIMPFAAHLAVVHLSLQALLYETEKVRVAVWDSTELKPGQTIPAIWSELKAAYRRPTLDMFSKGGFSEEAYVTKGTVTMERIGGEKIPLEQIDLVIMNPPFTRQERLPIYYKEKLVERLKEYETYMHGQLGLHGFFIFLADRFLKPGGKIALVLPASILRVKSNFGVRSLLSERYDLNFIITSRQKLAFSEATWFGEILLIATKKTKEHEQSTPCNIVILRELPSNLQEASNLAREIKRSVLTSTSDKYETEKLLMFAIEQDELRNNVGNWFSFISTYEPTIAKSWKEVTQRASEKLITFNKYLSDNNLTTVRGIETRSKEDVPVQAMSIASNEQSLSRTAYQWVIKDLTEKNIVAENRFTRVTVKIPLKACVPALITYAGKTRMHISETTDFAVIGDFDESKNFFSIDKSERILSLINQWRTYVTSRMGNVFICRRYVPFAPSTIHTCYYSETLAAPLGTMWSLRMTNKEDAKIITLWMNSSLHVAQILLNKIEDIWIDVHKYVLDNFWIANPNTLSKAEREILLQLFDETSNLEFPSLANQIKEIFPLRRKIDEVFLSILGFGVDEINPILDYLYPALANEIEQLKTLMQG
jgi:hypothetical protein